MNQIQAANYSLSVQSPIKLVNDRGSVAADSTNPNKYTMTQPGMYDFTLIKVEMQAPDIARFLLMAMKLPLRNR